MLKYGGVASLTAALSGCTGGEDEEPEAGDEPDPGDDDEEGPSPGDDGEAVPNQVVVTQGDTTDSLDPQDFVGAQARAIIYAPYERLITLDVLGDGDPIPQLASDFEFVEETVARVYIRENVQWHNGDPLTVEDAAFTVRRVSDPDFHLTTRRELQNVSEVEIVDEENAIDIHLESLDPIFFSRMGYSGGVLNKEWAEEHDNDYIALNAMGTGPYQMVDFEPDGEAVVEKVDPDQYWNDEVDLAQFPDEIRFRRAPEASTRVSQLLAEETHVIEDVPLADVERIESETDLEVRDVQTDRTMMLFMRNDTAPFDSLEFRRAMNHAINKEEIVEDLLEGRGEVTNQIVPFFWFGHNPDLEENPPYAFDPERAEELVEESGYAGEELELFMPTGFYLMGEEVGNVIAHQVDSLSNVSCELTVVDRGTWRDMLGPPVENKPAFAFAGIGQAPPDSSIKIGRNFTCHGFENDFSHFCDDEIDTLLEEADSIIDTEERRERLQEINRVLIEEKAATVPIYFQATLYGVNAGVVDFTPIPQEEIYWFLLNMD